MKTLSKMQNCWRVFEVRGCASQNLGIVPSRSQEPAVAHSAEKASYSPCLMTVVHRETLPAGTATDGTSAILGLEEVVILTRAKAVGVLNTSRVAGLRPRCLRAGGTDSASGTGEEPCRPVLQTATALASLRCHFTPHRLSTLTPKKETASE